MNTETVKVDALGFAESAMSISKVIEGQMYSVMVGVRRARALLRLVNESLENRSYDLSHDDVSEVADLIETALQVLPHHYNDVNDPIEESLGCLREHYRERMKTAHELARIEQAMAVAAQPGVTAAELEAHAKAVYAIAQGNEAYAGNWQALRAAIQKRRYKVDVDPVYGPSVVSAAAQRKLRARVKELVDQMVEGAG